jgi:arginine N-succinyltransferase
MLTIRPVREDDIEQFYELVMTRGMGVTSLPKDHRLLEKRIIHSIKTFRDEHHEPALYIFVLVDPATGKIGGTCTIEKRSSLVLFDLHNENGKTILYPRVETHGPTELSGLYLHKEWRHKGVGHLLSFSRLLFIACFPDLFTHSIVALMRGYFNEKNEYPFWEHFGKGLCHLSRDEAVKIQLYHHERIQELLPKHPIDLETIPAEAKNVIGRVHPHTEPALKMLYNEGFTYANSIDIIDGGPKVIAAKTDLRTIKNSKVASIVKTEMMSDEQPHHLICNRELDFRAVAGHVHELEGNTVAVSEEVLKGLNLSVGDKIRFVSLK